ncbi:MAG: hypothetical protein ABI855_01460 [Bacteroidota bacterium]
MGITIHYKGNFNPKSSLSQMIEEVKDIAEVQKWKYHIFETEFPENSFGKKTYDEEIYGTCFSPPECEPVMLCFLSNGRMANPFYYDYWLKSKIKKDKYLISLCFTKTQFAGSEAHKIIIHLLRHISKKYLKNFSLTDEGHYWETNDEKLLEETFKEYSYLINAVSGALQTGHLKNGETIEEYMLRIFKEVHLRRKKE